MRPSPPCAKVSTDRRKAVRNDSSRFNGETAQKRLELLHELFPAATSFALVVNPTNPAVAEPVSRDVQTAACMLGLTL
jgi:putative ABC transport system substrate-binding protein